MPDGSLAPSSPSLSGLSPGVGDLACVSEPETDARRQFCASPDGSLASASPNLSGLFPGVGDLPGVAEPARCRLSPRSERVHAYMRDRSRRAFGHAADVGGSLAPPSGTSSRDILRLSITRVISTKDASRQRHSRLRTERRSLRGARVNFMCTMGGTPAFAAGWENAYRHNSVR